MTRKLIVVAILALLFLPRVVPADDVADLEADYETAVRNAETGHAERVESIGKKYAKALLQLKERLKGEGDLHGVVACNKEIERFKSESSVPSTSPKGLHATLRHAQDHYRKLVAQSATEKAKNTARMTQQLIAKLDAIKKDLVKDERLEEAFKVDEEIKKAEFRLAELSSKIPPEGQKSAPTGGAKHIPTTMPASLRKGLVLHYSFDNDTGTKVRDASTHERDGTIYGAKRIANSRCGGTSLHFDGTSCVAVPSPLTIGEKPVSCAMWIKHAQAHGWQYVLANKSGYDDNFFKIGLHQNTSRIRIYSEEDKNRRHMHVARYELDKGWHHVVVTRSGGSGRLYVDGKPVEDIGIMKGNIGGDTLWWAFGNNARGSNEGFRGHLDELMVWDRALSKMEIGQLYRLQK